MLEHPVAEGEITGKASEVSKTSAHSRNYRNPSVAAAPRTRMWLQREAAARSQGPEAMPQVGMRDWGQWEATDKFLC